MEGVIAAVPTPFDQAGAPDKVPFLEHCSWALANGCDGLNVLGSTGEANSLSTMARMDVMRWAALGLDKSKLMVGTGLPSLEDTVTLTRFASELGYRVALVLPPFYYKPLSEAGLIRWYEALHRALDAHPIEIYFYNFPQMTGLTIPVSILAELARRYPARFTGIKDSSGDLDYARAIVAANPDLRVFPSTETCLAEVRASGFAGCISATVNISAARAGRVWRSSQADPALQTIRATIAEAGLIPAIKFLVGLRSGAAGWAQVQPPFLPLDPVQGQALAEQIQPFLD